MKTLSSQFLETAWLQPPHLKMALQPIIDVSSGEVVFYEALARIACVDDPSKLIMPAHFIPDAEASYRITKLDHAMIRLAIDYIQANPSVTVAVNISAQSVTNPDTLLLLSRLLNHERRLAKRLVLEITETTPLLDMINAVGFIEDVKRLGCRVALDDFGTGYTSLLQLEYLPVDYVKIAGELIGAMKHNPQAKQRVENLATLLLDIGYGVIAEHVEDEATRHVLGALGINWMQGYLFAKPQLAA